MQEITPRLLDEIQNHIYQRDFLTWDYWLNQRLGVHDSSDKRHERIADIAITIFNNFHDRGYYLQIDKSTLFNKILVWAYTIDKEFYMYSSPYLTMDPPKHRDLQKDIENYEYTFNALTYWNNMRSWADPENCQLFATIHASSYFWANLSYFVYRFIDITRSPFVNRYDEEEKKIEDEEIESLIEQGIMCLDKKGRLISAAMRDTNDD